MSEIPANNEDFLLQQANQTLDEGEEEGVPISRGAHIGIGLFATAFGGAFGGIPLGMLIAFFMDGGEGMGLLALGLFVSPFILIGGTMFIAGITTLVAGIIGDPLIKDYDDEDEEEGDERPTSTAFAYTSEDDIVKEIRGAQAQPALAETSEKAPTLGWGMAPSEQAPRTGGSLQTDQTETGSGGFWGNITDDNDAP